MTRNLRKLAALNAIHAPQLQLWTGRDEPIAEDGTCIPVTLLKPKDMVNERDQPCLLWGYGRFGMGLLHLSGQPGLPLEERLRILDKIERAGCLWLQMTGGEVLADPLFGDTYKAAHERGLQVSISTNGTLLTRWMELFRKLPPRRITMNLYGASPDAYAAMTGACGDHFATVIAGLDAVIAARIPLRVSIIAATPNVQEVDTMEGMMRERGVEYHTYWNLTPTLAGKRHPTEIAVKNRRAATFFQEKTSCAGGISSLHVDAPGRASPCKLLPHISVDLLNEDLSRLSRLCHHPGAKPVGPGCEKCASSANCVTCAPVYALHKKAGHIPRSVCRFRPMADEGGCGGARH